jgi:hypothetical protein
MQPAKVLRRQGAFRRDRANSRGIFYPFDSS